MRFVRQSFVIALATGAALLGTALPTLAGPKVPEVPPHRHFIQTPNGRLVRVGPRVCDDPSLQHAFNRFHANVHIDANGLHDHQGADIVARGCSFVP